ncbi:MAG: ribosomal protein S18-alanine N-acetyltransferase [Thermoanaerobaculia bacterium]
MFDWQRQKSGSGSETLPAEVRISKATDADVAEVYVLERECFPAPWKREFFESEVRASGRFNLVARDSRGSLIGYLFGMHFLDEMHINKIAVAESHRRHGIATILMERCFEFARERHLRSISLEVREMNQGAQDFYRRLAFHDSYRRPRYYPDGEAAVVMTRSMG